LGTTSWRVGRMRYARRGIVSAALFNGSNVTQAAGHEGLLWSDFKA
jgi:hypothetical protein